MTPSELRALAARVETEEPTDDLRAAVLTAFGSEAEWLTAPNPLVFVDDAKSFQPEGWRVWMIDEIDEEADEWFCELFHPALEHAHCRAEAPTEPRARTAASLRALAWEKEQ